MIYKFLADMLFMVPEERVTYKALQCDRKAFGSLWLLLLRKGQLR